MNISMGLFTFINVWCIALFAVLPFCIERGAPEQANDYVGAPKKIAWKKIVVINTILSIVITATIALVIKTGIVPVRN